MAGHKDLFLVRRVDDFIVIADEKDCITDSCELVTNSIYLYQGQYLKSIHEKLDKLERVDFDKGEFRFKGKNRIIVEIKPTYN